MNTTPYVFGSVNWSNLSANTNITWDTLLTSKYKATDWATDWYSADRDEYINTQMIKKLQKWFVKSDVKRELMEKLWHPRNMHKWSGWGYDILEEEQEEQEE